jgi:hypothetical protein
MIAQSTTIAAAVDYRGAVHRSFLTIFGAHRAA